MPRKIDVATAHALLLTRDDLRHRGCTERDIERLVREGVIHRVRNGRYISADDRGGLWNEGRHLVDVVATHLNSHAPGPVFWGPSAAVIHGLPLYRLAPEHVHTAIIGARHGRTCAGVVWHNVGIEPSDIVEIEGIRCTSLDRTVLDLARSTSAEVALSAADAALRSAAVAGHMLDTDAAAAWSGRMSNRAERSRGRGIRRARWIIDFADGRAQLPGESVSRLQLARLGFARPQLQVRVVGPSGEDYWLDFGFRRAQCFGEFDGTGKYFDEFLRGGRTAEEVVMAEKRREDAVRGVTGWRIARWGSSHILSTDGFARTLAAYGIRPPG
ncbi:type IV toxin-antitoxin system AbiEi family antitoxin domain-containing protein [Microbacterium sp. 1.5R]|uniref:type IV toxin-antitoxin system AbiEi family antitoxin domain-containing protein n=1 Tax=Microbacterium sp. 1.5R TaxID=1916917 RepID=UPI0011A22A75|nr:type IV toxin-antitoxin system AbiEi family antitoxin domain-containing protein [Microbacterium sp. 1.5R]